MPTDTKPQAAETVRVAVAGPEGRMGRVMMDGLPGQAGLKVVGGLSRTDDEAAVAKLLTACDVLVDFTHPESSAALMLKALEFGVRPVSGTTGLSEETLAAVDQTARRQGIGAVWAPHFRLAGVLMIHFGRIAARYFDSVEIIEAHHATKADSPSGTAIEMARMMQRAHGSDFDDPTVVRETLAGTRGGVEGGVRVHSLRLPDILGWHELVFAGDQELLTIRHGDNGRSGYVSTVATAVRKVMEPGVVGLIRGYDEVIGLGE